MVEHIEAEILAELRKQFPGQVALTIPQTARAAKESRSTTYVSINEGKLIARKSGRSTRILLPDAARYLAGFPTIQSPSMTSWNPRRAPRESGNN